MVHDKTMDELDKKDFDYTSKMIARERGFSYTKEEYSIFDNPNPIVDGLKKVVQWPGGEGMKYCSNCIHWVKKKKTHGNSFCNIGGDGESTPDYCVSHSRLYYIRRHHSDPENDFITEEEMELE